MRSVNAAEFKAKCLAILDEVDRTGVPVTILKRGRPVARVVAATSSLRRFPQDDLAGSVEVLGEIDGPVLPAGSWAAERRARR